MSDEKDNRQPVNSPEKEGAERGGIDRRDVIQGIATLPVLGVFAYAVNKQVGYENAQKAAAVQTSSTSTKGPELNVALLGAGAQGEVLLTAMLRIPNLRFRAVCDIWTEYALRKSVNTLKKFKFNVNGYEDYREMLDKEKDLDAVVIATPDFWHAQHTIDCLKAGKHVYCEKEMSNTLESARKMVETARETGKLLQIGHQRRSHPRYIHAKQKLITEAKMLGRIVTAYGQWNRSVQEDFGWPSRYEIPIERLKKYGFSSMSQYRNWRWYKGLGGGPIVDLGSHQIDIYNWFLDAQPTAIVASGGKDYYTNTNREWYDTVMAVYEYQTKEGAARAYYQTQTTNGSQGYFETFMGDQGTLVISESETGGKNAIYREKTAPAWDEWVQKGYVSMPKVAEVKPATGVVLDVRESVSPDEHKIPIEYTDAYHKPHLENFFNSVRGYEKLNCPPEIGYETAVTVLKVNEAVEAGRRLTYNPNEFKI